jgi:hypothetical protein
MPNVSMFETSNWEKLSRRRRVEALQGLENSMAAEQGRSPRAVKSTKFKESGIRGQYRPQDTGSLHISKSLIKSNDGNYQAMQTAIHEGRHAYQDDCVTGKTNPSPQDKGKVASWSHNMPGHGGAYYNSGAPYRYQPVEADANDYAKDKMNSFDTQLGKDPAYVRHSANRDTYDRYTDSLARQTLGNDYRQKISDGVERSYQAKQQQKQMFPNQSAQKKTFDFKQDKVRREQKAQKTANPNGASKYKAPLKNVASTSKNAAPPSVKRGAITAPTFYGASKYRAAAKSTSSSPSGTTKSKGQNR